VLRRTLVLEREMPHPPERVSRASSNRQMRNDFQPVVGHKFTFRCAPMPHWNGVTDCEVLVVEPNRRLSYTWNASGEVAAHGLKTVVAWTLTPITGGVLVRMSSRAS
jgi:uncharacterized protein YndB with AHSA1/START domain